VYLPLLLCCAGQWKVLLLMLDVAQEGLTKHVLELKD
jgi:hypothetical protein